MKTHALSLLALAVLGAPVLAGGSGWQTDFEKAQKKALKSDRPMLVEFTEGDASKSINKKIFYTGKFKSWSKKNVILVEINFSKRVSKKLAATYADLKKKYKVESFPTVLLIDGEGKTIGSPKFDERTKLEAWLKETGEIAEGAGAGGTWITDWEKAKKLSKRTKKPMLVDFNGSDW